MKCNYQNHQYRDEHDDVDVIAVNYIGHLFIFLIPQGNTAKATNNVMKGGVGGG